MSELGTTDALNNDRCGRPRIGAEKVELQLVPTNCRRVVDEISAALRPVAAKKGLSFEVVTPDSDVVIRTDRHALSRIILDLALNAIKFTECGMVGITVDQIQQGDEKTTEFHIVDTGSGIRTESLNAIMQSFGRIQTGGTDRDESRSSLEKCQRLARLLGGEITVRSAPGKGSTFTFVLTHKD